VGADFVVRWDDWSGGEYGVTDPAFSESNQWSGQNIMLYESGLLGVRPGMKLFATTGLPAATTAPGPVGFDVYDESLIAVVDNPYRVPLATGTAIQMGSYPVAATKFVRFSQADGVLYSVTTQDGKLYKHENDTTVPITLPAGVALTDLTRWGYYLIGPDRDKPWRLYFSKVSEAGPEFDVWEDNAYVDVGSNLGINTMVPMFNSLLCGKKSGWWALSGVLGDNPYVRHVEMGNGPVDGRAAAGTTDNRVLYWSTEKVPHWFNGESVYLDEKYRIAGYQTGFPLDTVIATPTGRRMLMLGKPTDVDDPESLLIQQRGSWSAHALDDKLAGLAPQDVRHGYGLPDGVIFGVNETDVTDPIEIVSFEHDLQRPGHTDDLWAAPNDQGAVGLINGALVTPAWFDAQGRMVMVRNIQIQFRKWTSGIPDSLNELHVKVRPLARWQAGTINTDTQMWTEPSERAAGNGVDDSWSMNFGSQGYALGFQIEIPRMRGIAIREINVSCEVRSRRS